MAIDERSRHEPHQRLDDVLGPDAAGTLMAHLPPVGWSEVATKTDLTRLEERMDARFVHVDQRFEQFEERMNLRFDLMEAKLTAAFRGELVKAVSGQTRAMILAMLSTGSLVLAATHFH